jgi:hypothetical protein
MSSLRNKTPSESFRDLINIGSTYNGLSTDLQNFNDGFGNQIPISASRTTINIDFNGGALTSYHSKGAQCKGYELIRTAHSDSLSIYVGQPSSYIIMSYFTPEVIDGAIPGKQRILVNIRKPNISSDYISYPYYASSDIYLYKAENPSPNIVYAFQAEPGLVQLSDNVNNLYEIDGVDGEYHLLRAEIIAIPEYNKYYYKINLLNKNIFGIQ